MADETATANGVSSLEKEDQTAESFYDLDQGENESELKQKIEVLEGEKLSLVKENKEAHQQMAKLTEVIDSLKLEEAQMRQRLASMEAKVGNSEEIKKAVETASARAAELETQVSRLQHELISAMSDGQETSAEVSELKKVLAEKDGKLEELKKERAVMDKKVRELEMKVGLLEVKETEEKSKRVRIEEEMRTNFGEKVEEMSECKRRVEELEEIMRSKEASMALLKKQVEEAQGAIDRLKDKTVDVTNGNGIELDTKEKGFKRGQSPVVAVGIAGAVVAAAAATTVVVLYCAKRR